MMTHNALYIDVHLPAPFIWINPEQLAGIALLASMFIGSAGKIPAYLVMMTESKFITNATFFLKFNTNQGIFQSMNVNFVLNQSK